MMPVRALGSSSSGLEAKSASVATLPFRGREGLEEGDPPPPDFPPPVSFPLGDTTDTMRDRNPPPPVGGRGGEADRVPWGGAAVETWTPLVLAVSPEEEEEEEAPE